MQVQVAVDCHDPHRLCRFWAALMDYRVEQDPAFVQRMLDEGQATQEDTIVFDGVLCWATAEACSDPDGKGPRLLFQHVPEAKAVKNRVHLDLHPGRGEGAAMVEKALGLGATKLWDGQLGPMAWTTLADPEGNEFCISA